MAQRGEWDILLTGWWWGHWESASSTFWFQQVWDPHACGQQTVNFCHLGGGVSISAKQLKDIVISLKTDPGLCPQGYAIVFWWLLFCLCIVSLPWLATVWTCPLELRKGVTERLLCPGAPQGPAQFQRPVKDAGTASKSEPVFIVGT